MRHTFPPFEDPVIKNIVLSTPIEYAQLSTKFTFAIIFNHALELFLT